jgi:hypothetical protein
MTSEVPMKYRSCEDSVIAKYCRPSVNSIFPLEQWPEILNS